MSENKTPSPCVYKLVDPRTGETKYIGTTRYPDRRKSQHQGKPRGSEQLRSWKSELKEAGEQPVFEIVERAGEKRLRKVERSVIDEHVKDGVELLNSKYAKPNGGGSATITIQHNTIKELRSMKQSDESYDDVVRRLIRSQDN